MWTVAVETRSIRNQETWLEWRKNFVTASRVGGLPAFDCHPYETPLRLYATLRGVEFENDPDSPVLRRGRWLEPAVARAVSEMRPEWELEYPNVFLCDPEIGLGATPDYLINGDPRGLGILQIKTVAPHIWARDWQNGEEIPLWIILQALTEAMLADATFAVVAAMLVDAFNMKVVMLDVPRHPPSERRIIDETRRFMIDVNKGIEPDPDFERDGAILKLLLPRETPGEIIDLSENNEVPVLLQERAVLLADINAMKARCETICNRLKYILGDAEMATGINGFSMTFKTSKFKEYTVPAHEARVLRIRDKRPPEERPVSENDNESE